VELETRIKELSKEAKECSRQGIELIEGGKRREGHNLMRRAYEASQSCQALVKQMLVNQPS
jgi:hypothetical protein